MDEQDIKDLDWDRYRDIKGYL